MNAKVLAIALALGAVLATVSAECPNACSGHGECALPTPARTCCLSNQTCRRRTRPCRLSARH